jgi:hypothetical protein
MESTQVKTPTKLGVGNIESSNPSRSAVIQHAENDSGCNDFAEARH